LAYTTITKVDNNNNGYPTDDMSGFPSWLQYFKEIDRRGDCGDLSAFEDLPTSYCENADTFRVALTEHDGNVTLLVPGAQGQTRTLHNCLVNDNGNQVIGVFRTGKFSPWKQVTVRAIVRPMTTPGSKDNKPSPTEADFLMCDSVEEFKALESTGKAKISSLSDNPSSYWVHPHVLATYFTKRKTNAAEAAMVIIQSKSHDEDADKGESSPLKHYVNLLTFLWAVEKGFAQGANLNDPPDDDETDKRVAKINHTLEKDNRPNASGDTGDNRMAPTDNRGNATNSPIGKCLIAQNESAR
jgi:hypothetical protein